jgi:flagella basal body P-ring formation protein FlgA
MAVLDPRLLDLIHTLVVSRLDWLAFELIEGVQVGRSPEEPAEVLAATRESIRGNAQPKARGEPQAIVVEAKPIPPDEQIEWAAAYVEERLGEALEQLNTAIDTLDFVVEGTTERPDEAGAVVQPTDTSASTAVVVLQDVERDLKSGRDDVTFARESFPILRAALSEWTAQLRGQVTT